MRGLTDLKAWASDVLVGLAERFRECQGREPASRRELIRVGLLGSGVLLVLSVDLGRWFLAG